MDRSSLKILLSEVLGIIVMLGVMGCGEALDTPTVDSLTGEEDNMEQGDAIGPLPGDPEIISDPEHPGYFFFTNEDEAPAVPDLLEIEENVFVPPVPIVNGELENIHYSVSSSGFYSPLSTVPTYNCTYASSGGISYTTLWGDNTDGGATCRSSASSGYSGSLCDSYDNVSGSYCNAEFCGRHPGVDIGVSSGNAAYAITSGTVYRASTSSTSGWGRYIILRHYVYNRTYGSWTYIYVTYAHMSSLSVTSGSVSAGQVIGSTGNTGTSTGAHLHFQMDRHTIYGTSTTISHPYWPSASVHSPDWDGSDVTNYTYHPLTSIGFGTCY